MSCRSFRFQAEAHDTLSSHWEIQALPPISPPEKRGSLFGIAASLRIFGVMIASLLGGAIIGISGSIRAVFIWTAILFAMLLPLMYLAQKIMNKNK